MSHQSGIGVSQELLDAFAKAKGNDTRAIKVEIENEAMVPKQTSQKSGNEYDDLEALSGWLEEKVPCYVLLKGDDDAWVLCAYVPDNAKVRPKMLYASSRATLKNQLGNNEFKDELYGTDRSDFTAKAFKFHGDAKRQEAPLTEQERVRQEEKESGEIYTGAASTYVHGVAFPVENGVIEGIKSLISGNINYIRLSIDIAAEKITTDDQGKKDIGELPDLVHETEPRFYFYAWDHEHESSSLRSIVFIYSCPDGTKGTKPAPVKMRMLFSSSKQNVANILEATGGKIDAKIEVNTKDELSVDDIRNTLHPPPPSLKAQFSKPVRNVRGPKRLERTKKE